MVVLPSNGSGITVIFADVPFTVAVFTHVMLPVVPPTQIEQLSKKAVPFGVPLQSIQEVSVLPQPQLPFAVLFASVGQASPELATKPLGLAQAFKELATSPMPSLSVSAYHVIVDVVVIVTIAEVALQPSLFVTSTVYEPALVAVYVLAVPTCVVPLNHLYEVPSLEVRIMFPLHRTI